MYVCACVDMRRYLNYSSIVYLPLLQYASQHVFYRGIYIYVCVHIRMCVHIYVHVCFCIFVRLYIRVCIRM